MGVVDVLVPQAAKARQAVEDLIRQQQRSPHALPGDERRCAASRSRSATTS